MGTDSKVTRIAIADDDPDSLELVRAALQRSNVEISQATGGGELVELLVNRGPFDLIVTDIDMPWMDGIAVVRSARAAQITTPVLIITGIARMGLQVAVARLGNARLLEKPVDVSALRDTIEALLKGSS